MGTFPIQFSLSLPSPFPCRPPRLTSQVCDNRLTEAVLRPITIAKKEFRFLWALQLRNKESTRYLEQHPFARWLQKIKTQRLS